MSSLQEVVIRKKRLFTPRLMSIQLETEGPPFTPGQFFNLSLKSGEEILRRSYSAASAPGAPLEFFLSEVPGGGLTPRVFRLNEGDSILLDQSPLGFFTLNEVPESKELWAVATGTGLGPFLSMLREGSVLSRFEKIILVHGVRHEEELAYRAEFAALREKHAHLVYIPALSAPSEAPFAEQGRITTLFESGRLEEVAQTSFGPDSHMLLCGNPQMIEDMTAQLKARGFEKHRRKKPGHFNFERYW
jgi:ferredoxin--NADP+ reductase